MKLGYCQWGMPSVPLEQAVPRLAAMGYQGVEIAVIPRFVTELSTLDAERRRAIRRLFDDHKMAITAVAAHSDITNVEGDDLDANLRRLHGAIELAAEWARPGQPGIVVSLVGGHPDQWEERRGALVERVGALDRYAAERGVTYALELHIGTALDLPDKLLWLMREINSPTLRMNYDQSHTETMGIPISECVPVLAPLSVHTHVKDQRGLWPNHEFLTPGEGPFNYVEYLRAMDAAGYQGFIMAEVSMMRQAKPDYEPFVHAAFAYRVLDYAFQAADLVRDLD